MRLHEHRKLANKRLAKINKHFLALCQEQEVTQAESSHRPSSRDMDIIQGQGEFAKPHYCCIIDWLGHGSTAIETAGSSGVPITELNFDDFEG